MTRRPKAETRRSGSLAVSTKMKIAIAATTPMDKTSELKRELIKDAEKKREGEKETCVDVKAACPS